MTELSRYMLEPLWEDGEFGLSCSVETAESRRLLAVVPLRAVPGAQVTLVDRDALRFLARC